MRAAREDAALWGVAVHEGGHVAVAAALGATGLSAWATARDGGNYDGWFEGPAVDEAVIALAGGEAALAVVGDRHRDGTDRRTARRLLAGTGVSVGEARRRARALVAENRVEILRLAMRYAASPGAVVRDGG